MSTGARLRQVRLLQLASPALPIGAYSYSSGLETAIGEGRVADGETALQWIGDMLTLVIGRFDAPVAAAAHAAATGGDRGSLGALSRHVLASRETAELRLETEQMGYSLDKWIRAVLEAPDEPGGPTLPVGPILPEGPVAAPVAWGAAGARLGLDAADTVTALLWGFAENQVMVLLKAMPMGQIQGQRVLDALVPVIDRVTGEALARPAEDWSTSAPGLAIASMRHEVQYSRLFRS